MPRTFNLNELSIIINIARRDNDQSGYTIQGVFIVLIVLKTESYTHLSSKHPVTNKSEFWRHSINHHTDAQLISSITHTKL